MTDEQLTEFERIADDAVAGQSAFSFAINQLCDEVRRLRAELAYANDIIKSWSGR